MDDRLDLVVARAAAEQGLLDWPILEEALEQQRALVSEGRHARLVEILAARQAFSADTVRALLHGADRAIMRCNSCGHHFTIHPYSPNDAHLCPSCETSLVEGDLLDPEVLEKAVRVFAANVSSSSASAGLEARGRGDGRTPSGKVSIGPGTRLKHYEIVEKIGEGGMGVVFKARHSELNTTVAVKVMYPDKAGSEARALRFQREAKAAGRLRHPNIVSIHDVDQSGGIWYIVMDYIAGPTLAQHCHHKKLPAQEAARIVNAVSEAIHYAHTRGVIHRDLKPSNILIDPTGNPYVMDFGLAKEVDAESHLTVTGAIMGTPLYMSPEQAKGQTQNVDEQSDVYALGAILFESLTGRPPFIGSNMAEILRKVISEVPQFSEHDATRIPIELQAIAHKALEKSRVRRYRSARDLAMELGRYLKGEPVHARPSGALDQALRFAAARKKPLGIAGGVLAILAGIGGYVLYEQGRAEEADRVALEESRRTKCSTAEVMLGERRWAEARTKAEEALNIAKGVDAYVLAGRAALGAGDFDAAEKSFDRALEIDGKCVPAYMGHGDALVGRKQDVDSLKDYDSAARLDSSNPAPRAAAGIVRARLAEYRKDKRDWITKALEDCTAAIDAKDTRPAIRRARARMLVLLGRPKEAVADYEALLVSDPRPLTIAELGLTALMAGDIDRAESCHGQLSLYDPLPVEAVRLKARLQAALGQAFESSVTAWSLLEAQPGDFTGRLLTGNYQRDHGEYPEANGSYVDLEDRDPDAEVFRERGRLYERWKKYDRAIECYDKAVAFDPTDALAVFHRGRAKLLSGDEIGSLADWELTFCMRPEWRGWHNTRYGRPIPSKDEIAELTRRIEGGEDTEETRLARGRLWRGAGAISKGIADFEAAAEKNPKSLAARLEAGQALLAEGNWEKMVAAFKAALEIEPGNDIALWGMTLAAGHVEGASREMPALRPTSPRARLYAALACQGASFERRDLAMRDLSVLLAENPTTLAEVSLARGVLYAVSARLDRVPSGPTWTTAANAFVHLSTACEIDPDDPIPLHTMASFWWGFGDRLYQSSWLGESRMKMWGEGLVRSRDMQKTLLDRLIARGTSSLFYARALVEMQEEKYANAIEALTRSLNAGPQVDPERGGWRPGDDPSEDPVPKSQIYAKRSKCKEALQDVRGAIEDLTLAFEADPTATDFLIRRAELHHASGDLAEAAADYGAAIALAESKKVWSGTLLGYYRKRGFLWLAQEKIAEAEADFKHCLELQAQGGSDFSSTVSEQLSYGLARCAVIRKAWGEAWTHLNDAFRQSFMPWVEEDILDFVEALERDSGEKMDAHLTKEACAIIERARAQRTRPPPPDPNPPPPPPTPPPDGESD